MNNEKITEEKTEEPKKEKSKLLWVLLLTAALAGGAGTGFFFIWRSAGYLVTDNARVTTTLIAISSTVPGTLERFTIQEGRYVEANEILGWVEQGEAMRSPVDGIVIHTNAVQDQVVSPMEPLAIIADINNLHIQANIEETDILRIRRGQNAIVTIDGFGSRQFSGYVAEVGHVTAAELTGNAIFFNTGGTFTRVTHLLPVRINIIDDVNLDSVIGVNARVRIPLRQPVGSLHLLTGRTGAQQGEPVNSITVRGTVESILSRNVYTTLGALVERIHVEAGDSVTEGQILGVLDAEDLTNSANIAEASLRIAEINLTAAEHNLETRRALYSANAIAREELRQSEFALQAAVASHRQAQAMFDAARLTLERSVIRSPIDGTVTAVIAREGAVGMGLLFIVADINNLKITTSLREYDLDRIETGMEVFISSDATGDAVYTGIINRINPAATAFAPVAEFETEVLVTSNETALRVGTTARLNIVFD